MNALIAMPLIFKAPSSNSSRMAEEDSPTLFVVQDCDPDLQFRYSASSLLSIDERQQTMARPVLSPMLAEESIFEFYRYTSKLDFFREWRKASLVRKVDAFAERQNNWDGMDGVAPTSEAIEDAKGLINRIPSEYPLPKAVLSPGDGEVLYQWRTNEWFVEVGFYGDQTISWYAENYINGATWYDDAAYDRNGHLQLDERLARSLESVKNSLQTFILNDQSTAKTLPSFTGTYRGFGATSVRTLCSNGIQPGDWKTYGRGDSTR